MGVRVGVGVGGDVGSRERHGVGVVPVKKY